jgi:type IV fimbrial biogenesis protein FimT
MSGMTNKRANRGVTMIEMAIVMSLVAILAMIAIPSFKYVTSSNRAAQEVNALLGDMRYARTEAIKEGAPVTVCASADGLTCSGSTQWNAGWIVFADANGNHVVDVNEPILRVQKSLAIEFNSQDSFQATLPLKWVVFNREGFGPTGLALTANVALHDPTNSNNFTRCVAVTILGLVSTVKFGVGGCL